MKIKQLYEDFKVIELYDLNALKLKDEEKAKPYYYFILEKTNYAQIKAIEKVASVFSTSSKLVHFAGTKDKTAITRQLISVYGVNPNTFEDNLKFFNENVDDLKLEYIGEFKSRLNLGDNLSNEFFITIRDLEKKDIQKAKNNIDEILKQGVLNYFDDQRFGYAKNTHIVGKYVLLNEVERAYFEILTSMPDNPKENLVNFIEFIKSNWEQIKTQNIDIIDKAIELIPVYLRDEKRGLEHLKKYKNDFPGAFKKIHKKIRTLYINAYQSYLFNETIKLLKSKNLICDYEQLELINKDTKLDENIKPLIEELLEKDKLSQQNFKLTSMPELKIRPALRETLIEVKDLKIIEEGKDELNEGKLKIVVNFKLQSGAYATNVVKQMFE